MSLRLENASYAYDSGTGFEKLALDNVSVELKKGELVAVVGETGSGKSTMVQLLCGIMKPTAGTAYLDEFDLSTKEGAARARFNIGLVFQYPEYQLFEETIRADIGFAPKQMGLSEEEIKDCVDRAMESVGLSIEEGDKSPFDLSGGQKRRVALAGILAMHPEYLILDEPTAGLDAEGREGILQLIRKLAKKDIGVMWISHRMEDVAAYADRVLVMADGKLLRNSAPRELFAETELLEENHLAVPDVCKLWRHLKDKGHDVGELWLTIDEAASYLNK